MTGGLRARFRLVTGPSALGVHMTWAAAMALANYLAFATGRRMTVRPHPMPSLGWVVDQAEDRPRLKVVHGG